MADWLDELAAEVAAMTEGMWTTWAWRIFHPKQIGGHPIAHINSSHADAAGIVALRNEAARLIGIARAARELLDDLDCAEIEGELADALRKALEGGK